MAKLAILGLGPTGTSIAIALKAAGVFDAIAAFDPDRQRMESASSKGAITASARNVRDAVFDASVVIAAVTNEELPDIFRSIASALAPGCIVSDTADWKLPALEAALALPASVHYVGGRPALEMSDGQEQSGPESLRGAVYCLTPSPDAAPEAVDTMSGLVTAMGAQPYFLTPEEHDGLFAATELVPRLALAALLEMLTSSSAWRETGRLAGQSFNTVAEEAERLDTAFWQQVRDNRQTAGQWLERLSDELLALRDALGDSDHTTPERWTAAQAALANWRKNRRQLMDATLPPASELRPNLLGFRFPRRDTKR